MNVLLTSVGRRSYLVDYFKDAVASDGKVIAANSEALTSGMVAADKAYTVPRVDTEEYIPAILKICQEENVGLVVSLFDIDLPYLSRARQQFLDSGIQLVVSDPWVIDLSNDKWSAWQYFESNNIATPATYLNVAATIDAINSGDINYPLIIKPRWGMGSISIFKAETDAELVFFYNYAKKQIANSYLNILSKDEIENSVVIQQCIVGKEYGVDVFNNLDGEHLQTIAKQKIAMRSGETDMARIVSDSRLQELGERLADLLQHRGNIDVDVLENDKGELFVLEVNARFGGGYPFSHLAGANFPAALVAMAKGEAASLNHVDMSCVGLKEIQLMKVPT